MNIYHISRGSILKPNDRFNLHPLSELNINITSDIDRLFPKGLSTHGLRYLQEATYTSNGTEITTEFIKSNNYLASHFIEYNLELVRKAFFPNSPSRFTSLFVLENLQQIVEWPEILQPGCKIYQLESDIIPQKFDASLLKGGFSLGSSANFEINETFSPLDNLNFAYQYWEKRTSEKPRFESLLDLSVANVTVIQEVKLAN
jgi:hypothetical protein